MGKTFYLAGKLNASEASIAEFSGEIEANGHRVLEKWWEHPVMDRPYRDHADVARSAADTMLRAAYTSDVFVLFPGKDIFGALAEYGMALASRVNNHPKEIYFLDSPEYRETIFYQATGATAIKSLDYIRELPWFRTT